MFRSTATPSRLVQVEIEVTLDGLTHGALAWVARHPRPYIGMPRQIADRQWWVTRIPDQAKRGTLSPETLSAPAEALVSEENLRRALARRAAGNRKAWATRRRAAEQSVREGCEVLHCAHGQKRTDG